MKLVDYMKSNNLTASAVAAEAGVSLPRLTRAIRGETSPGDDLAIAIERITKGVVSAHQFNSDCFAARHARQQGPASEKKQEAAE